MRARRWQQCSCNEPKSQENPTIILFAGAASNTVRAQRVQKVQIRACLQLKNLPANCNFNNRKMAPICTKRTPGARLARKKPVG